MNIRIAYYVIAFAISFAAFTGAYGYTYTARADAYDTAEGVEALDRAIAQTKVSGGFAFDPSGRMYIRARDAARDARAITIPAFGTASAVALTAFAGAYILDKRRVPPEG